MINLVIDSMIKKKGISPVIAVVMLLLIVVVMVGGVFTWMQMIQEDVERVGEEQLEGILDQAREHTAIEMYSCDDDTVTSVTLYNGHAYQEWEDMVIYIDGTAVEFGDNGEDEFDLEPGRHRIDIEQNGGDGDFGDIGDALATWDDDGLKRGHVMNLGWRGETVATETFTC